MFEVSNFKTIDIRDSNANNKILIEQAHISVVLNEPKMHCSFENCNFYYRPQTKVWGKVIFSQGCV